ncbi:hypothetical protein PIB30_076957 [Stylosanthes scabra]|uniref:Uncharacterized protein n=1 Tax=Stylosanthes scabra TaxID=79078 RepID=A0ABU6ZP40_9FABA|nr:hypothetical protein [Stylosanthes scabra]
MDDSASTDKTQPSRSKMASVPLNVSASSWVPPQQPTSGWIHPQPTSSWVPIPTNTWVSPQTTNAGSWPEFGLPLNYTPQIESTSRGQGGFVIRNIPIYSNPTPNTQHIPQ